MAEDSRKSQLIADLARSRALLSANALALRGDFDVGTRMKSAYSSRRYVWLGGAALLGVILGRTRRTTPQQHKVVIDKQGRKDAAQSAVVKTGVAMTLFKLIFDIVRPVLTRWLTQRVTGYAAARMAQRYSR